LILSSTLIGAIGFRKNDEEDDQVLQIIFSR